MLGTRWRRLNAGRQGLLALAHLRCGHTYAQLVAGFGIGTTTAYRYVAEAVDVLAAFAPTLAETMETASIKAFVILDGTLLPVDRIAADRPFYFGKHKKHGVNVQVISDPAGRLLWASPALPGAVHDIKAARSTASSTPWKKPECGAGQTRATGERGHRASALLGALAEAVRRSAGRQPRARENSRTRRTGHRHPQDLADPAQAALLHHPHHEPRPGHPQPAHRAGCRSSLWVRRLQ